ncbi:MAG TPA: transglutaminase-like cysteine peptidase [Micavibrio sp.]
MQRHRLGELLVMNGHLTTGELRYALALQRRENKNLGQILIDRNMVSAGTVRGILIQQYTLRVLVGFTTLMLAFTCLGFKPARAGSIKDIPAQMTLASTANAAFAPVSAFPALFNAQEKRSGNLEPFTKWTSMFGRFEKTATGGQSQRVMNDWKRDLMAYQGLPLRDMVEQVNALVNKTAYIEDTQNYAQSDYWATPIEFFTRGGDCEDFAIAKYVSLRALGVPESRMRIAIVQDLQKNIPHAVLIVYTDEGAVVLDNQNKRVLAANAISHYKPIFSINRTAWWLHTKPDATRLASAQ